MYGAAVHGSSFWSESVQTASPMKMPHRASHLRCVALSPDAVVVVAAGGASISAARGGAWLTDGPAATREVPAAPLRASIDALRASAARNADSLAGWEEIQVERGCVTSLALEALPSATSAPRALGVVGTSAGGICVFQVLESGRVVKLSELDLLAHSQGRIGPTDLIVDVCISLDPAGRPECVAAATSSCVVVLDVLHLLPPPSGIHASSTSALDEDRDDGTHLPIPNRPRSETLCCSFVDGDVVRVLSPLRHRASFAVDIAFVVVLGGTILHYVTRQISSSASTVRLLMDHHRELQQRGQEALRTQSCSHYGVHASELHLAHVLYTYQLSSFQISIADLAAATTGGGQHGRAAAEEELRLADAALTYNARRGRMDLIVCGCQLEASTGRPAVATQGWWAVVRGVVLPEHTTHTLLAKGPFYGLSLEDRRVYPRPVCGLTCQSRSERLTRRATRGMGGGRGGASAGSPTTSTGMMAAAAGASAGFVEPSNNVGGGFSCLAVLSAANPRSSTTAVVLGSESELYVLPLSSSMGGQHGNEDGSVDEVEEEVSAAALPALQLIHRHGRSILESLAPLPHGEGGALRLLSASGSTVEVLSL